MSEPGASRVRLGDPAGRTRWEFTYDGHRYAVFAHEGRYVVVDALCPHRQGRLGDGVVRDGSIVCPSHWYRFDLDTGRCRTTPRYTLGTYPVESHDGALVVDLPSRPRRSWLRVLRERVAHRARRSD